MAYIPTIGMEIHFHLKTTSKMFCGCANTYSSQPNVNICPVCTGQPGALPVPNQQAIEWIGLIGLGLNCQLAEQFSFERKNYFYPDLPKGYQITSTTHPPCIGGHLMVGQKKIRVNHIHLEEDTGSLKHDTAGVTLVDLNRSSAPLVELVTEPDMTSGWEAKTFCSELQLILRTLEVADADMEKGQMRCEVNISLRPEGQAEFGTKVEIKNLNSFRAVERAIEYEIERQAALLDKGETVSQETRGWDEKQQRTVAQRRKEEAHDYRYFPEPDIPPLTFDQARYEQLRATLPELPAAKRQRFMGEYGFAEDDARILANEPSLAAFTEAVVSELQGWLESSDDTNTPGGDIWRDNQAALSKLVSGWITSELFKIIKDTGIALADTKVTPENFAEFLTLVYQKKINSSAAQQVLQLMVETGQDPSDIVEAEGLSQLDDTAALTAAVQAVVDANPDQVAAYKGGKEALFKFFVGQVMKETKGRANPEVVGELLKKALG